VIGRKAGSLPDYDGYSKAMLGVDVIWTSETLAAFLRDPEALVPGTRMESHGRKYWGAPEEERQKVLQFIQDPDNSSERCSTKYRATTK
jgi:cytochrome c